jgi:hypothetical protein
MASPQVVVETNRRSLEGRQVSCQYRELPWGFGAAADDRLQRALKKFPGIKISVLTEISDGIY